ncbi:lipopolysaccharide-induced tumor necrosis factor-alpha factor homolog [Engraulis encrasicolus]|uniref:lipopolysaccharide-induced tumor necrosis factor-alpha factor homolog n=1 Tax=Engraulis encrasicolus TaxID=184585 RepID=UPI002FD234A5
MIGKGMRREVQYLQKHPHSSQFHPLCESAPFQKLFSYPAVGGGAGVREYQTTIEGISGGDHTYETPYEYYENIGNEVNKVNEATTTATATQEQTVNVGQAVATSDGMKHFVSVESQLGHTPGMTTCTSCEQQVLTEVRYKIGVYAWLICLAFILCGMVTCGLLCLFMPLSFLKRFKDAYHSCPRCHRVLHVDKKKCCQRE